MIPLSVLDEMSLIEIDKISSHELFNVECIKINTKLPIAERMKNYLDQIKNPYCFLCGDIPVRVRFSSDKNDLSESLKTYFINIKNG